jgi:hypothetical protein
VSAVRCPYCGRVGEVVRVHGHGQCPHCGTNVEPCCAGANALAEAAATPAIDAGPDRALFPATFELLGGLRATVADDALAFAIAQRLGIDLVEARELVDAAERVGIVEAAGPGAHRLRRAGA